MKKLFVIASDSAAIFLMRGTLHQDCRAIARNDHIHVLNIIRCVPKVLRGTGSSSCVKNI